MKKFISSLLIITLCLTSFNTVFAKSINTANENEFTCIDPNGNKITVEVIETATSVTAKQYDSKGKLEETATHIKGSDVIKSTNAKTSATLQTSLGKSKFENNTFQELLSAAMATKSSYNYIGNIVFTPHGELTSYTMRTSYQLNYKGTTTYAVPSTAGTIASLTVSLVVGLGVGASGAGVIIGAILSTGLCYFVGEVLHLSTSINLSCKKYENKFHTYDQNQSSTYNHYGTYGNKFIVSDCDYPNRLNEVFYEGITYHSLQNGDTLSYDTLLYNTYSKHGVVDFGASTVFN